jgi:ABC-type nitrate/sulfonate/bicarbonate transport system substrate-binding protein
MAVLAALSIGAWLGAHQWVSAQTLEPVRVITFRGAPFSPVMVGVEKGFYQRAGLDVSITFTPNSVFQMTNFAAGKFDVALTLIDNVIAYVEGQGEVKLDRPADMAAIFGLTTNEFSIVTVPEVKTIADLKGRELSVDALTTGNSYAMMELLRRLGLPPGDYKLVSVGGADLRATALEEKKQAGTNLGPGTDSQRLLTRGFNRIGSSRETIGTLEGLVGAVNRPWAAANEARTVAFVRATAQSVEWLLDPANRVEAAAILRKYINTLPLDAAERSVDALRDPQRGIRRGIALDMEGVRNIMAVRARFAQPAKELNDPGRYVDTRYHQKAGLR